MPILRFAADPLSRPPRMHPSQVGARGRGRVRVRIRVRVTSRPFVAPTTDAPESGRG